MATKCMHCGEIYGSGEVTGTGCCPDCKRMGKTSIGSAKYVDISWIFIAPFKLIKWLVIVPVLWIGKKTLPPIGRFCWAFLKNKWTWNIFTCGFSWVAWKMLDAIYNPKD